MSANERDILDDLSSRPRAESHRELIDATAAIERELEVGETIHGVRLQLACAIGASIGVLEAAAKSQPGGAKIGKLYRSTASELEGAWKAYRDLLQGPS